jgi:hypothetical protein
MHQLTFVHVKSRTKGRLHYYSTKREEYAQIRFDLDAGKLSFQMARFKLPAID